MSDTRKSKTIILVFLSFVAFACYLLAQSSGGNHGSGNGTVGANNGSAGAVATYAAAGGSTTVGPSAVTYVSPTLTVPGAGVNGQLGLGGSTSGTFTITAPPVAGTSTNPATLSNVLAGPNGACVSGPTYGFSTSGAYGIAFSTNNSNELLLCSTGGATVGYALSAGNGFTVASNWNIMWASTTDASANGITIDTALNRVAANIVGVGTTNGASTAGSVAAASFQSRGTTFTASGCGNTTLVGGATAGKYTSVTAGSCTVTITMGNSATAPNGWVCDAHDLTTVADANNVTMGSSTTTTANLVEGTVAASDVISFKCTGY
jgi:hypothetical protein